MSYNTRLEGRILKDDQNFEKFAALCSTTEASYGTKMEKTTKPFFCILRVNKIAKFCLKNFAKRCLNKKLLVKNS